MRFIWSYETLLIGLNVVNRYFCFLRFYLFLERGEGREKERERNIDV